MSTREDIFINIISKFYGKKEWKKQEKLMSGFNKKNIKLKRSFEEINGSMKKVTTITASLGKKRKRNVVINERLIDISDKIEKANKRNAINSLKDTINNAKLAYKDEIRNDKTRQAIEKAKKSLLSKKKAIEDLNKKNKSLINLSKQHRKSVNKISKAISSQGVQWKKNVGWVDKAGRSIKNMDNVVKKGSKAITRFNMNALGVMFAGMAIKRVFDTIRRAAINSFTKIMESNNMLGTAVQRLGVYFEYLKFTIGSALNSALEPLMPKILDIVNSISEWIQKNPELTSRIILLGTVIGTVLLVIGQLSLGIKSILGFMGLAGSSALVATSAFILLGLAIAALFVGIPTFFDVLTAGFGRLSNSTKKSSFEQIAWGKVFAHSFVMVAKGIFGLVAIIVAILIAIGLTLGDLITKTIIGFEKMSLKINIAFDKMLLFLIRKVINFYNRIRAIFGKKPISVELDTKSLRLSEYKLAHLNSVSKNSEKVTKNAWLMVGDSMKKYGQTMKDLWNSPLPMKGGTNSNNPLSPEGTATPNTNNLNDLQSRADKLRNNKVINQTNNYTIDFNTSKTEELQKILEEHDEKNIQMLNSQI